jgi:hypothetical protein
MIAAFARMLGSRERVLSCEETSGSYSVRTRNADDGVDAATVAQDAPPEQFVERIPHEGGDVYLAPVLDTLRAVLRSALGRGDAGTVSGVSEKDEEDS